MKTRILHIRADFSPEHPIGGALQVIKTYIQVTESDNYENFVLLICNTNSLPDIYLEFLDLPTNRVLVIPGFSTQSLFKLSFWKHILHLINQNRIDILHSHSYKADFITVFLMWLSGKKIITTVHGYNPASASIKSRLIWIFFRYIWLFFNQVILVSETMLQIRVFKFLFILGKVTVVENFIPDLSERQVRDYNEEKIFTIVSVGRLAYEKNQILLCKALKIISSERCFKCFLVGDGPERIKIEDYITGEDLHDLVTLVGFKSDVKVFYDCADVVVIPSLYESFSLVMLEAMSTKCPVIAARIGKMEMVLSNGAGLLFERDNEFDLAEKIIYAMDHPEQLEEMAENARMIFEERFTLSDNSKKLISIYK